MKAKDMVHCEECGDQVELCVVCNEIIHEDDPKAIIQGDVFCHYCFKKKFRDGCPNKYPSETQGKTIEV